MPHSSEWLKYLKDESASLAYRQAAVEVARRFVAKERELVTAELSAKKEELERLQMVLEDLDEAQGNASWREADFEQKYSQLARRAAELQYGRLPIQDFPVDILRIIFGYLVEEDVQTRWVLSRVCRAWMNVTFSTATLWSNIEIDFTKQSELSLHMLQTALSNGAESPLFLHLLFHLSRNQIEPAWATWGAPASLPDDELEPELAFDYVELAVAHIKRWRSLTWTMEGTEGGDRRAPSWIARKAQRTTLNNLQDLKIISRHRIDKVDGCSDKVVQGLCTTAIHLTSLSMRNCLLRSIFSRGLKRITLDHCHIDMDGLLSILRGQQSLRSLQFSFVYFGLEEDTDGPSFTPSDKNHLVEMPCLRRLYLSWGFDQHGHCRNLLSHLSCPALRRAVIRTDFMFDIVPDMIAFLSRVSYLTHIGVPVPPDDGLPSFLEELPFVEEFGCLLWGWSDVDEAGPQISNAATLSIIGTLPSLKHLSLSIPCEAEDVLEWLLTGARTSTLETFYCADMEEWTEEDRRRVDSMLRIEKRVWLDAEFESATEW